MRPLTRSLPRVGPNDARDDLQQRRLARAVLADQAQRRAGFHRERDVLERAKIVGWRIAAQQVVEQAKVTGAIGAPRIVLADAVDAA